MPVISTIIFFFLRSPIKTTLFFYVFSFIVSTSLFLLLIFLAKLSDILEGKTDKIDIICEKLLDLININVNIMFLSIKCFPSYSQVKLANLSLSAFFALKIFVGVLR